MKDVKSKLLSRPREDDTKVLYQSFIQFEESLGLFEKWIWDGVSGCSIVLLSTDVPKDKEVEFVEKLFLQMKLPLDKNRTSKISEDFYFLNFNFRME